MPANRNTRGYGGRNTSGRGFGSGGGGGGGTSRLASSGPLITNHFELRDLDLELALLKRKREMIQEQHTMLISDNQFGRSSQYGFNQGQSYGQRSDTTHNFSNLYNDPPASQFNSRFHTQQGMKRLAIDPWDNAPPKRFNAAPGPKKPAARYESRPPRQPARPQPASQPPPLMSSSYRPRRPPLPATRTNFKPNKITKPRQNTAPNKLDSHNVAERKKLVGDASGLVEKLPDTFVFEADKPTHPKLLGRLELALGTILREMRQELGSQPPHAGTFAHVAGQRSVKQAIRERIRTIMNGKRVASGPEIVALYRKKHPQNQDVELLETARQCIVQKDNYVIEIIKRGNPERYFKSNFRRLLDVSLQDMFEKITLLYNKKSEDSGKQLQEIIDEIILDINKTLPAANELKNDSDGKDDETNNKAADETVTPDAENIEKENAETEVPVAESTDTNLENGANVEESAVQPQESDKNDNQTDENVVKTGSDESVQNGEDAQNNTKKEIMPSEDFVRARFYNKLMDVMIRRTLPVVLPKYKETILKILNTDSAFKETKAYLIRTTNERAEEEGGNKREKRNMFFVKILGRPILPKKQVMKTFLETFHPTLIKKHKNLRNVLFVSFDAKENLDNILAKNGTTLDDCRLDIRISQKLKTKVSDQNTNNQKEVKLNDSDVEMVETTDDIIKLDDTLDNQINDLLTSIRNEEEDVITAVNEPGLEIVQEEEEDNPEINQVEQEENGDEAEAKDGDETEAKDEEQAEVKNEDEPEAKNEPELEAVQKVVTTNEAAAPAAKGTPTRSSARLTATPSTVRTRRASKLAQ